MTTHTITLPLPPEILHPNGRTRNRGYRSAMVRKARGEARFIASAVSPSTPWQACELSATFHMKRRRDEDGLIGWLKAYIDGIADAGFVANDSRIRIGRIEQVTGRDESLRVELSLSEVNL